RSFNPRVPAVVASVHETAEGQLPDVAQAMGSLRLQPYAADGRQEQGRENTDNGNRHQQFDQSESAWLTEIIGELSPHRRMWLRNGHFNLISMSTGLLAT